MQTVEVENWRSILCMSELAQNTQQGMPWATESWVLICSVTRRFLHGTRPQDRAHLLPAHSWALGANLQVAWWKETSIGCGILQPYPPPPPHTLPDLLTEVLLGSVLFNAHSLKSLPTSINPHPKQNPSSTCPTQPRPSLHSRHIFFFFSRHIFKR